MLRFVIFSRGRNSSQLQVGLQIWDGSVLDLEAISEEYGEQLHGLVKSPEISMTQKIITLSMGFLHELNGVLEDVTRRLDSGQLRPSTSGLVLPSSAVKLHPPVLPKKILSVGGNYEEHMAEIGKPMYSHPVGHWKAPSTLVGPDDNIIKPKATSKLDYEVELGVIIGKRCRHISEADALEFVAGYTICNDITARDLMEQDFGKHFALGKNFDTFLPVGPCMVTQDEIDNPHELRIQLRVNGEIRQNSNTSRMYFKIPKLISFFSSILTLEPGDLITTGTPGGVAAFRKPDPTPFFLKDGDIIEAEIEKIGVLRNRVVEE